MSNLNTTIYFLTRDEFISVNFSDVMYITADGNYVDITLRSGRSSVLLASLHDMEKVLDRIPQHPFLRVGRSHIVNLNYIVSLNNHKREVHLADDITKVHHTLSISRDSVRLLREDITKRLDVLIPDFLPHNGKMQAYQGINS